MVNKQNSTLISSCALGFETETILVVLCCQHSTSKGMLMFKLTVLMLMIGAIGANRAGMGLNSKYMLALLALLRGSYLLSVLM